MWIPDRGREGRGQVPATSPAHGAQRSRKGRRRRLGRILPKFYFIGSILRRLLLSLVFGLKLLSAAWSLDDFRQRPRRSTAILGQINQIRHYRE